MSEDISQYTAIIHDAQRNCWLWFKQPLAVHLAYCVDEVVSLLQVVEQIVQTHGYWAAGFVSYEASSAFDPKLSVKPSEGFPLLCFGIYGEPEIISSAMVSDIFATTVKEASNVPLTWEPSIDRVEYQRSIERIKDYIRAGDTYQVNYTFRLHTPFSGDPWMLFAQMMKAQECHYGAWVNTPDWTLCCASPEMFFQQVGREVISQPMKGTMSRGAWYEDDRDKARQLQGSEKNRAENVMIVDMVRNDLARIADLGSVQVTDLFEVEQYPTVWQMTSKVRCTTDATITEIFQALFPPASITGAPKQRTMQIIAELETAPRRIYTGTVGFITPQQRSQFNVAIRTVLIDRHKNVAEYGVGGGIVWDSTVASEFEECRTKTRILTQAPPDFALLETMLWTPQAGIFLLHQHLERLEKSARYFSYALDMDALCQRLTDAIARLPAFPHKVRLTVPKQDQPIVEIQPVVLPPQPVRVCLAKSAIDASNPFLFHKTTHRKLYQQALQDCPGYDDVLLWNQQGELTESCIANVVVEMDGQWVTPPINCGLLPGTYRSFLLQQGKVTERVIRVEELALYPKIFLVNSVRQHWEVNLVTSTIP